MENGNIIPINGMINSIFYSMKIKIINWSYIKWSKYKVDMKYNLINRFLCFSNDKNSIMNFIWILLSKNFYPQKISLKKSLDFKAKKCLKNLYTKISYWKFLLFKKSVFPKISAQKYSLKFISENNSLKTH